MENGAREGWTGWTGVSAKSGSCDQKKPWGPRGGSHHGPPEKSNPDFQIGWRVTALTHLQRPLQEFPGVVEPEHVVTVLDIVLVEQLPRREERK